MHAQVKRVRQSVYFNIRNMNSIREILDDKSASRLKHAFVLSQLDIGNSLLINIKSCHLVKLKDALNAAARVLSKSATSTAETPLVISSGTDAV